MRLVMTEGSRNYNCNYSLKRPAVQPLLNGHLGQQRESPVHCFEFNERFNTLLFFVCKLLKTVKLSSFLIQYAR